MSDFDAVRKRLEEQHARLAGWPSALGRMEVRGADIRLLLAEVERLRAALGNELSTTAPSTTPTQHALLARAIK